LLKVASNTIKQTNKTIEEDIILDMCICQWRHIAALFSYYSNTKCTIAHDRK
jgi:hypothetical protein